MIIQTNNDFIKFSGNGNIILKDYRYQCMKSNIINETWLCGPAQNVFVDSSSELYKLATELKTRITYSEKTKKYCVFRGAFPGGFLEKLKSAFAGYYPKDPNQILHVCSGRIPKTEGKTLDISKLFNPDYLCNAETMEIVSDEKFEFSISDTPYNIEAADKYWEKPMINRSQVLHQMNRVTKIGGFIGILDQVYPHNPKNLEVVARIAVSTVPNLTFRAFTVFKKLDKLIEKTKQANQNQKLEDTPL